MGCSDVPARANDRSSGPGFPCVGRCAAKAVRDAWVRAAFCTPGKQKKAGSLRPVDHKLPAGAPECQLGWDSPVTVNGTVSEHPFVASLDRLTALLIVTVPLPPLPLLTV